MSRRVYLAIGGAKLSELKMPRKSRIALASAAALAGYYLYTEYGGCTYKGKENLTGQVFIFTGATNAGVGKETARELGKRGGSVILGAKNQDRCHQARNHLLHSNNYSNQEIDCALLDLKSFKSIQKFVDDLPANLNVRGLINAAETVKKKQREETHDGLEKQMGVSHFGHFLLTSLLLQKYGKKQPLRVTTITYSPSNTATLNLDDLNSIKSYSPEYVYRQAKLASLLIVSETAHRLGRGGATINAVNPGSCDTEVFRHLAGDQPFIVRMLLQPILKLMYPSPEKAAQSVLHAALSPKLDGISGKYIANCRIKDLPIHAEDLRASNRLWVLTEQIIAHPEQFAKPELPRK